MNILQVIAAIILMVFTSVTANARESFTLKTPESALKVDVFTQNDKNARQAIVILSGSRGFNSAVYDDIGNKLAATGLDVYLAHLISPEDLHHLSAAKDANSRIKYYRKRRADWSREISAVLAHLNAMPRYAGRVGLLGISLGAETAAITASQGLTVAAVVLVDGSPPRDHAFSSKTLPPFHLIWGSADTVYPVSSGQRFMEQVKSAGGTATMTIFQGAKHDFFLKSEATQANEAYKNAAEFLKSKLNSK